MAPDGMSLYSRTVFLATCTGVVLASIRSNNGSNTTLLLLSAVSQKKKKKEKKWKIKIKKILPPKKKKIDVPEFFWTPEFLVRFLFSQGFILWKKSVWADLGFCLSPYFRVPFGTRGWVPFGTRGWWVGAIWHPKKKQ